jgi:acyl-ACP thioesterase
MSKMSKVDVWQETCTVRFGGIDRSDRLTMNAVFQFFQEAAISHADNLGVGREDMARTGTVWIVSRMSVQIDRRPRYGETVTVRSWPRGGEKLFALRDYDIRDASDVPVVRGRSGWLIVDIEKRRPLRPQSIMDTLPQNTGLDALPPELAAASIAGLAERQNLRKAAERRAAYTDVDYNGHVNNVRYIQWIEDTLDPALLEQAGRMRLDINYLNETLPAELTEISTAPIETAPDAQSAARSVARSVALGAFAFEGRKTGSGQVSFRAELRLW